MDNQANINKESWKETLHIMFHPSVLIPSILGIGAICLIFKTDDEYWKMILTAISSIGIGIGVNYFTFFFKDNTKYNNLLLKKADMDKETAVLKKEIEFFAKSSVNVLKTMSLNIVERSNEENRQLNTFEKRQLGDIEQLIRSYEAYYKPDFTTNLSDFVRMGTDPEGTIIYRKNYTTWLSPYGIINDVTGSGTVNDAVFGQNDPTNFGGSRTNPPTFGQE